MSAVRVAPWLLATLVTVAGCTTAAGGTAPATTRPASRPPTTAMPTDGSPGPAEGSPPDAALAAEGGDPVIGQLGTYLWRESGSDAPWLPGSPIRVGQGEPLTVALDPGAVVATWRARYASAATGVPDGAIALGGGNDGHIAFTAPGPGTWTVEVQATFADGLGSAAWYWALEVE